MPPCAEALRGAARWAECESVKVDGKMTEDSSGAVNVAGVVGRGCPEARECCSEQRTPGGGMTLTPLWLHLMDEDRGEEGIVIFHPFHNSQA